MHGERGGVRQLGTDGAVENRGGAAATAYQRKAAVGAQTKCTGKVLFYRRALHGGNTACTEGEPKVMAWHGGRAMGVHARGEMGQLGTVQRRGTHAGCIP
jgi:hypothetical protein